LVAVLVVVLQLELIGCSIGGGVAIGIGWLQYWWWCLVVDVSSDGGVLVLLGRFE
jgi:hypothetical protein